jgi:hypothetical protein
MILERLQEVQAGATIYNKNIHISKQKLEQKQAKKEFIAISTKFLLHTIQILQA